MSSLSEAVDEVFTARPSMVKFDSQEMFFELEQDGWALTEIRESLVHRPQGWQLGGQYSFRDLNEEAARRALQAVPHLPFPLGGRCTERQRERPCLPRTAVPVRWAVRGETRRQDGVVARVPSTESMSSWWQQSWWRGGWDSGEQQGSSHGGWTSWGQRSWFPGSWDSRDEEIARDEGKAVDPAEPPRGVRA